MPAPQEPNHRKYCEIDVQKKVARGVIGPSSEHTYVTFLNYCFVKLLSKHTCLHGSIRAVLNLSQRSISLLGVVVNAELYKLWKL